MNIKLFSAAVVAAFILAPLGGDCFAATRKLKKEAEAAGSAAEARPAGPSPSDSVPSTNSFGHFWSDPEFVKRFMGSYGMASEIEPRLSAEEQTFHNTLRPLLQEDPKKAARELEARTKPDSSATFNFILGTIYFQSDLTAEAIKQYEAAVAKFPDFRRARKNLGFALVQQGQFEEAIPHLTRVIELGGGDSSTYGLLGFAYLNLERHLGAESAYRQALLHAPENLDWKLGLIKSQIAAGNYRPASELLAELIGKFPDRDSLWALQAGLFLQMDKPAEAAVNYEALRKLKKASSQNLMLLGDIHMTLESRDLALSAYLEAVELDEGRTSTRALRAAEILLSRGATAEARQLFQKIRQTAGADLGGEDQLKLMRLEAKAALADDPAEGARLLEALLERNPLDGEALLLLGDQLAREGEREKADYRYELASRISGFEAEAQVKRAQLLVQSRKYAQALELLRQAQKSRPRDNVQRYIEKVEIAARNSAS